MRPETSIISPSRRFTPIASSTSVTPEVDENHPGHVNVVDDAATGSVRRR